MSPSRLLTVLAAVVLTACQAPTLQRYESSSDLAADIRALRSPSVAFAGFRTPADFSPNCRGLSIKVADGNNHGDFIRQAYEQEFRAAGALAESAPRVTLTGSIDQLQFTTQRALMTGGSWMIAVTLTSSNGQRFQMHEYYEFDSGVLPQEACRKTSEAYQRAVQNLVRKTVTSEPFAALLR